MKLTLAEKALLFALGECYAQLNKPLEQAHLELSISKITFIELFLSKINLKQQRALYKNLEQLEDRKLIKYAHKKIIFTPSGLKQLKKIQREIKPFLEIKDCLSSIEKPRKKLQTIIRP